MLVLTRRDGETIQILTENDEVITLTVTQISSGQVKLGISAPPACRILRQELIEEEEHAA
jgi:carbon storage regulator CsrA